MSTLSNAEKQKILRERRQNRLKSKGSERLNKITSRTSSFAASGENFRDTEGSESVDVSNISKTQPIPPQSSSKTQRNKSHRISSILEPSMVDFSADPEVSDVSAAFPSSFAEDEVPDFFGQMMNEKKGFGTAGRASGSSGTSAANGAKSIEDFMNSVPGLSGLSGLLGMSDDSQSSSSLNAYYSNQFKAKFLMARIVVFVGLVMYSHFFWGLSVDYSNSFGAVNFYRSFLGVEAVLISFFYFYTSKVDYEFVYDSFIPQILVSLVGMVFSQIGMVLNTVNKYHQMFSLLTTDISICVVTLLLVTWMG